MLKISLVVLLSIFWRKLWSIFCIIKLIWQKSVEKMDSSLLISVQLVMTLIIFIIKKYKYYKKNNIFLNGSVLYCIIRYLPLPCTSLYKLAGLLLFSHSSLTCTHTNTDYWHKTSHLLTHRHFYAIFPALTGTCESTYPTQV